VGDARFLLLEDTGHSRLVQHDSFYSHAVSANTFRKALIAEGDEGGCYLVHSHEASASRVRASSFIVGQYLAGAHLPVIFHKRVV